MKQMIQNKSMNVSAKLGRGLSRILVRMVLMSFVAAVSNTVLADTKSGTFETIDSSDDQKIAVSYEAGSVNAAPSVIHVILNKSGDDQVFDFSIQSISFDSCGRMTATADLFETTIQPVREENSDFEEFLVDSASTTSINVGSLVIVDASASTCEENEVSELSLDFGIFGKMSAKGFLSVK